MDNKFIESISYLGPTRCKALVGVKTNPGIENYPVILFSLNQYTTINKTSPCCVVFLLKNNKTQNYPLKEYGQ
jgi:hypothetical protein